VLTTHRRRSTSICTLACIALLAAFSAAAVAAPTAQERYYRSYEGTPAQTLEDYYSSYGAPDPLSAPSSPASDDTPWLAIAASIAGAILIVAAATSQVHRVRIRRRRTARPVL
jgi:hypothetical protein